MQTQAGVYVLVYVKYVSVLLHSTFSAKKFVKYSIVLELLLLTFLAQTVENKTLISLVKHEPQYLKCGYHRT